MNKFVTIVAVTVGLSCCAAVCAQTQRPAAKKTYQQTQAEQDLNRGTTSSKLLIDHGGPVLPSSTSYAIYWGTTTDFPADLQSGMESLLSGFNGSNYLGIAQQYMRGASVATLYGGALVDTSAPPAKPATTANIAAEVCKLFPSPDPSAVYFVFTSNAPKVKLLRLACFCHLQRDYLPDRLRTQPGAAALGLFAIPRSEPGL
jgi:hypothetical protein